MKLSVMGLALTAGILWGAACFGIGFANWMWPSYGDLFLAVMTNIYPGYHGPTGLGSVLVVTTYALLDGLVCGAVFAGLYNLLARKLSAAAA